jgi:hypothetical protein
MKTIETKAAVTSDRRLIVEAPAPADVLPGEHRAIVWLDEASETDGTPSLHDFPVIDIGPWPAGLSLRRGDMYGDDGR